MASHAMFTKIFIPCGMLTVAGSSAAAASMRVETLHTAESSAVDLMQNPGFGERSTWTVAGAFIMPGLRGCLEE